VLVRRHHVMGMSHASSSVWYWLVVWKVLWVPPPLLRLIENLQVWLSKLA